MLLMLFFLKGGGWSKARGEKFDMAGSVVYGIGIAMFIYGFSSTPSWPALAFFLVGTAVLIYFIRRELRMPDPIFDVNLYCKNRVFMFSNLVTFIN